MEILKKIWKTKNFYKGLESKSILDFNLSNGFKANISPSFSKGIKNFISNFFGFNLVAQN